MPWDSAQSRYVSESAAAARLFEAALRQAVPMNPRALQQAPLRVLVGANMPAVLVEVGYLTNAEQEDQLRGGEFQGRVVQAIADGIVRFDARRARAGRAAAAGARPDDRAPDVDRRRRLSRWPWASGGCSSSRSRAGRRRSRPTPPPPQVRTEPTAKIRARLFHLAEDGLRLQPVDSEVPFGDGTLEQGRQLDARAAAAAAATVRLGDPAGHDAEGRSISARRASRSSTSAPRRAARIAGGSLDEIFTVYSIVNTLTDNLPAIAAVQLLVDGHQVDTLAGHVDVRRPLRRTCAGPSCRAGGVSRHPRPRCRGTGQPPRRRSAQARERTGTHNRSTDDTGYG